MFTVVEIARRAKKRELSFREIAEFYTNRIGEHDKRLNAYLTVHNEATAEARRADDHYDPAHASHLYGVPYAVKDNILVEGMRCTAASRILDDYTAPYEATAVQRLAEHSAPVLGKTNMDEFAMGSSTENSAFGATKNPRDASRVPGGSSGGSAAAVAAGMAPFALGSDTGGSIRQPAAFCGVVGFKPTYGAVSRHGLIAMASSLDQIGTLTQTVEDAQVIFPHVAGRDIMDATSQNVARVQPLSSPEEVTIGVVSEFMGEGLSEEVRKRTEEALEVYRKLGVTVKEISLPSIEQSLAAYYIIMPAEVSSNMARYDGVKYGAYVDESFQGDLLERYLSVRGNHLGKEVQRRIMLGTYTLSAGYYDAYYATAQKARTLLDNEFLKAFSDVDIIATPTTPTPAFKFGEKTDDPLQMYLSDVYTVSANLTGVPALSIPVGGAGDNDELPVGLQLMAPRKEDYFLLDVARLYEEAEK